MERYIVFETVGQTENYLADFPTRKLAEIWQGEHIGDFGKMDIVPLSERVDILTERYGYAFQRNSGHELGGDAGAMADRLLRRGIELGAIGERREGISRVAVGPPELSKEDDGGRIPLAGRLAARLDDREPKRIRGEKRIADNSGNY